VNAKHLIEKSRHRSLDSRFRKPSPHKLVFDGARRFLDRDVAAVLDDEFGLNSILELNSCIRKSSVFLPSSLLGSNARTGIWGTLHVNAVARAFGEPAVEDLACIAAEELALESL
jgi:hypothetical protein